MNTLIGQHIYNIFRTKYLYQWNYVSTENIYTDSYTKTYAHHSYSLIYAVFHTRPGFRISIWYFDKKGNLQIGFIQIHDLVEIFTSSLMTIDTRKFKNSIHMDGCQIYVNYDRMIKNFLVI